MAAASITVQDVRERLVDLFPDAQQPGEGEPDIISMTHGCLIDIEEIQHWQKGIGTVASHSISFSRLTPILYLFGEPEQMSKVDWRVVQKTCQSMHITVMRDDEDYEKIKARHGRENGMSCHEYIEATAIDGEAERDDERDSVRVHRNALRLQQDIINRQLINIRQALHQFSPEAMHIRIGLLEISRQIELLRDRFTRMTSEENDVNRIVATYVDSELIFDEKATTNLLDYKLSVQKWHTARKVESSIMELRRRIWCFLSEKGIRVDILRDKGATVIGIRLKHDPHRLDIRRQMIHDMSGDREEESSQADDELYGAEEY